MTLLAVCQTREGAQIIECLLIDKYAAFEHSENNDSHDRGGTGRSRCDENGLWYVYMVWLRGDHDRPARRRGWGESRLDRVPIDEAI